MLSLTEPISINQIDRTGIIEI